MGAWPFLITLLWAFGMAGRRGRDLTTRAPRRVRPRRVPPPAPAATPASTTRTAPWPQAVPAGLPPFPSGWEPDSPPGPGVVARANALVPTLWSYGPGTRKTEQTSGRWITYVATQMGDKRGVTAWRLRPTAASPAPVPAPTAAPAPSVTPAGPTVPASIRTAPARPTASHRTLRQGAVGEDVRMVQIAVGADPDGRFGPGTRAAVVAWQKARGLDPDGVVGPLTWAALGL